jgi:hypothetical protein
MPIPFDTHTFITDMTHAGMPEAQATVLSNTLRQVYADSVVTKTDLDLALAKLDPRFNTIDTRLTKIEGQLTFLHWLGGAIFAATVLRFFFH